VHLHGKKDTFSKYLTIKQLFTEESEPLVIEFDEGHKFPRHISDEGFTALKEFVRARYVEKNSHEKDNENFEVDYEKFNFCVRYPGLDNQTEAKKTN
jgi:hypothetical protein